MQYLIDALSFALSILPEDCLTFLLSSCLCFGLVGLVLGFYDSF